MFVCVITPGENQVGAVNVSEISYETMKNILGGDFRVLEIPCLKEKNIDVLALDSVTSDDKPSIIVINDKVNPPVITDAILGKVVLAGVDENKNTVLLTDEQVDYLSSFNDFTTVGTLGGKVIKDVLTFKA